MTQKKKAELIQALASTFGRECDEPMVLGYMLGVDDLSLSELKHAVSVAIRECTFMPSPVELRRFAGKTSVEQRAILAWDRFCKAAGAIGSYRDIWFSDPIINATVRSLGGWPEVLSRSGDEFDKWTRQEFLKTYKALDGACGAEQCRPLASLGTREDIQPVMLECDYVKCDSRLRELSTQSKLAFIQKVDTREGESAGSNIERLLLRTVPQDDGAEGNGSSSPDL
jgi:hypothetical protein